MEALGGSSTEHQSGARSEAVRGLLARLVELDSERRAILAELIKRGFRSRGFVGEWGEMIAAAYYGVELQRASQPGFDLVDKLGRRVQVKTLRSTPENQRASMGILREPYDVLFALRLDISFQPVAAFEIPRAILDEKYPGKRTSLTRFLETHPDVKRVGRAELFRAAEDAQTRFAE